MDRALEILILEDVEDDARLVEHALRAGGIEFSARRVEAREDFLRALEEQRPDVILADFKLPHFDGRAALKLAGERLPQAPVIIVTGTMNDEVAVELLKQGAADYILKDRLSRLGPAVRRALEEARAKTARCEAEEKYRALFDHARDGIVLVDCETAAVVDCNSEFERQCGRRLDELSRLKIWQLNPPVQAEAGALLFREIVEKGAGSSAWVVLQAPDGTQVPIELLAKVIGLGRKRYVLGIGRDISERLRAEQALRQQLDELRRFQRVTVDRELRLQALEERLAALRAEPAKVD
jgi:PAS domain S-box-containing protein